MLFKHGFLYKHFSLKYMDTDNVIPSYEIVQKFSKPVNNDDGEECDYQDAEKEMQILEHL
jgi:transcription elongation factor SPT5